MTSILGKSKGRARERQREDKVGKKPIIAVLTLSSLLLPSLFPFSSLDSLLDGRGQTRYNRGMELVQLKSMFAELKQTASDLRGFL
jgi:hypothetical protein